MPTLVLIRHAKAESLAASDHARRLAPRGQAQAVALKAWLLDRALVADRAVVSTAARTRETWELAGSGPAEFDQRVYDAEPEDLREAIGETPVSVRVLVLVGHNPGVERLAWELDDSEAARALTSRGMPTGGVAVFDVPDWTLAGAVLREVYPP